MLSGHSNFTRSLASKCSTLHRPQDILTTPHSGLQLLLQRPRAVHTIERSTTVSHFAPLLGSLSTPQLNTNRPSPIRSNLCHTRFRTLRIEPAHFGAIWCHRHLHHLASLSLCCDDVHCCFTLHHRPSPPLHVHRRRPYHRCKHHSCPPHSHNLSVVAFRTLAAGAGCVVSIED